MMKIVFSDTKLRLLVFLFHNFFFLFFLKFTEEYRQEPQPSDYNAYAKEIEINK